MPLYEYHCEKCDANVELLIRTAEEKPTCPTCGGTKLEKLLSVAAGHVGSGQNRAGSQSLPQLPMGCGKPQCGMGGCQNM